MKVAESVVAETACIAAAGYAVPPAANQRNRRARAKAGTGQGNDRLGDRAGMVWTEAGYGDIFGRGRQRVTARRRHRCAVDQDIPSAGIRVERPNVLVGRAHGRVAVVEIGSCRRQAEFDIDFVAVGACAVIERHMQKFSGGDSDAEQLGLAAAGQRSIVWSAKREIGLRGLHKAEGVVASLATQPIGREDIITRCGQRDQLIDNQNVGEKSKS